MSFWSPTGDSTGLDQSGAKLWAGIPTDAFGNGIVLESAGELATPGNPYTPQPQQDGSILDPTGLRTGSNGNGVYNSATGSDAQGDDLLGPNGENLMYRPFLNGVNRLAKAGQTAGNIAGAFNPLVNAVTAISGQNPDGSCASKGERIAAGVAAAGGALGEAAEAVGEASGGARQAIGNFFKRLFPRRPRPPYRVLALQDRIYSLEEVAKYRAQMQALIDGVEGAKPIEPIAGYTHDNTYYVSEGHHRMTAALEIFWETGNPQALRDLINNGWWTPYSSPPASYWKFPLKLNR